MASTITTRGYKVPTNGDTGSIWFPDIVSDINQMDSHAHNGADGASLAKSQAIPTASWVAVGGSPGVYSQVVTLPTYTNGTVSYQLQFDSIAIHMRTGDSSGNPLTNSEPAYPRIAKTSTNSYTVYTNDNTVGFAAFYI